MDSLDAPADNGYAVDLAELREAHSNFLAADRNYRAAIERRRQAMRRMRVVHHETNAQVGLHIGITAASVHTSLKPASKRPKGATK